jgi:DNA-binding XRE family transcriptional regulator
MPSVSPELGLESHNPPCRVSVLHCNTLGKSPIVELEMHTTRSEGAETPNAPLAYLEHQFGFRLRLLRIEAGLSQAVLARLAGVTQQAISRLEGGAEPNWRTACRLADALGRSPAVFFQPEPEGGS